MRFGKLLFASVLATCSAIAQTTGVVGINDYTVNGLGSGSTSCTPLCFPNGGITLNLDVSAPAGSFVFLFFNFCPCSSCFLGAPTNGCLPVIPATACGGSNQSLDMNLTAACGIAFSTLISTNSAGTISYQLPIPTLPGPPCSVISISTQAAVINACGLGVPPSFGGPFVLTQGYTLNF